MPGAQQSGELTPIEKELIGRLADEYKILQDKIDKIGAFRFTIRGWSITLIAAGIFARGLSNGVPRWIWLISLVVFLSIFFLSEKQQTDLRYRFGQRSIDIEGVLSRLLRNAANATGSEAGNKTFTALHYIPGIGRHVRDRTKRRHGPRTLWKACREADIYFYIAQAAVVVAFVFWQGTPEHRSDSSMIINVYTKAPEEREKREQPKETSAGKEKDVPQTSDSDAKRKKKKEKH